MNLALIAKDSNALYLLFYKLINNNKEIKYDIQKILNNKDDQIK